MSRYLIIIEETATGYSAYSPDLPGCIAAGKARDRVEREMHDAIEFHLDGLRRAGEPIPAPRSQASYCEVGAWFQSVAVVALSRRSGTKADERGLHSFLASCYRLPRQLACRAVV